MVDISRIPETTSLQDYVLDTGFTPSDYDCHEIDMSCRLSEDNEDRKGIVLSLPILSAAMQAVTGVEMNVTMDKFGATGVIFCSQPIADQAYMVRQVKRARAGFVTMLEVLRPTDTVEAARRLIDETGYSVLPIVRGTKDDYGKLEGILYNIPHDIPSSTHLSDVMRQFSLEKLESIVQGLRVDSAVDVERIISAVREYIPYCTTGCSLIDANNVLSASNLKAVPVINENGELNSLVFRKDLRTHHEFPDSVVDNAKRYVACAAVNTRDYRERVPALLDAGVDLLSIDTSDGYSGYILETLNFIKATAPGIPVIAGNVINSGGFMELAKAGAAAVKIGMGIGSICTTQEEKRTGKGQPEAISECAEARAAYMAQTGRYVPIIGDGGAANAGDMIVAFWFGADAYMVGRYVAGCDETPNPVIEDKEGRYKEYWGEGSSRARLWMENRYGQGTFEEGVVSRVPYAGPVAGIMRNTVKRWQATLKSIGVHTLQDIRNAKIYRYSPAAKADAKPHHVEVIR